MKNLSAFLLMLAVATGLVAQRPVTGSSPAKAEIISGAMQKTMGPEDTLKDYFTGASGFTIYNATGGFVFGTNYDAFGNANFDATGLFFDSVGTGTITGVYGWFARKHIIGSPDLLKCELYTTGPDSMPNTLLAYGNVSMAFLDTNNSINFSTLLGFQVFQLNQGTPTVTDDFFISMNYAGFDDTLGMVSTVQGDGMQAKRCRILLGSLLGGTWVRAWDFWQIQGAPIDADPVFFPIVEFPDTAVSAGQSFAAKNLRLYPVAPNPSNGNAVIRYELSSPDQVHLWVLDAAGRFVYDSGIVEKSAGIHEISLSDANLAPGAYYYTAVTSKTTLTSKFVVQ